MQIKKYEAVDMPSAIKMIKSDLGSDAVILSTRKVRKGEGTFGLFGRAVVEVTAAVDRPSLEEDEANFQKQSPSGLKTTSGVIDDLTGWLNPLRQEMREIRKGMGQLQALHERAPEMGTLRKELTAIKEVVQSRLEQEKDSRFKAYPPSLGLMATRLLVNDVDQRSVSRLLQAIQSKLPPASYGSPKRLEAAMRRILANIFKVQEGFRFSPGRPNKVALIGPTGVGKTTTIAKLAAAYSLTEKKKVALVTIDTYRISAVEQLKIYGKILGIPVDVVVHGDDLDRTFRKHQDKDLILVDTAGRNHRSISQMRDLQKLLGRREDVEQHLVLSTTTKRADVSSIIENYRAVDFHYLIFSKIDEGSSYGAILNAVLQSGKDISYLTDGQRVPEDLREATVKDLVDLVMLQGFLADENVRVEEEGPVRGVACPG
jgi:flagellar biosynthesis protein FlhF